jgi:hypothetical protein
VTCVTRTKTLKQRPEHDGHRQEPRGEAPRHGARRGSSYTFAIRVNGTDTAVQCTIPAGQNTCDSGTATAQIPPASEIVLSMTGHGSVDGFERLFQFGWHATTP